METNKNIETIENVTLYKCKHCRKIYRMKHAVIAHEPKCKKNPINYQPCLDGCVHLENEVMKFIVDGYNGEQNNTINAFWCNKHDYWVYPFWCNNPILQEDISEEVENIRMPHKCKYFSNKQINFFNQ